MRCGRLLVLTTGLLGAAACNQEDPLCGFVMHDPAETRPCEPKHTQVPVSFSAVTIAPDRLVLAQTDDGERTWQMYPLGADGFPVGDPFEVPAGGLGEVAVWPGPARTALISVSGTFLDLLLSDQAGLRSIAAGLPPRTRVAGVFDGRAYWLIGETAGVPTPVAQWRIDLDGTVTSATPTLALDPQRSHGAVQLASARDGEVVATWVEHPGLPSGPAVVMAQRLIDGVADGDAWTVAQGVGVDCLQGDHELLALADGYHVLARRGPCDGSAAPHLLDLLLDPAARVVVEHAGVAPAPELPRDWVIGPTGLVAWDERTAWFVDPARGAVDVAWTAQPGEVLRAAAALTTHVVLAIETADPVAPHVDLAQLGGPAERVVVEQDRWREDTSGCGASRSPSLLTGVLGALVLVVRRRARRGAGRPAALARAERARAA